MSHHDKTLRILRLDDPAVDSSVITNELEQLKLRVIVNLVQTRAELLDELQRHPWSFVLSAYQLKSLSASEALQLVKQSKPDLPFILFTESIGEESVADLMRAGAEDVVLRDRPERLIPIVKRILKVHDTQAKEARAHRLANEAFAAKEQMLAIVSHDIKNPLSAIQLEAQMLLRASERSAKSVLGEEVKIQANRILKTTDRMKILISDLLDKNKSENGLSNLDRHSISPYRLIQDVLDSLRPLIQEKEILLRTSVPENSLLSMDRNKMFQVFSNLINNAIKFTPVAGSIFISLEENEHEAIFCVEDSGPGLKDKEINKVFEKYWTGSATNCAGTGLGLFICKTVVEAHGGHIFVENAEAGARFKFTIPKIMPDLKSASFAFYDQKKDHRKKIYIVDDDEDLREVISWALGKEGYAIHSFHSPTEALDSLRKGRYTPELIVVDFHMDEMKGSEFVLKKNEILTANACPVVMISASPLEVEKEVPKELYREVLTKPIDLEGLVSNVKKFLQ